MKKLLLIGILFALTGCAGMDLTHVSVGVDYSDRAYTRHSHYRSYYRPHYVYTPPPVIVYQPRVVYNKPHHRHWKDKRGHKRRHRH